jgi:hypothetical protein
MHGIIEIGIDRAYISLLQNYSHLEAECAALKVELENMHMRTRNGHFQDVTYLSQGGLQGAPGQG